MNLTELRSLLVSFLKQLSKDDMNLLLNYLPIFLEDIQRDPLYLEKVSIKSTPCFNAANTVENNVVEQKDDNLVSPAQLNELSPSKLKNENNSQLALISSLIENNAQANIDNLTNGNMFDFDSYDEESDETNQSPHSQHIEMNLLNAGRSVYTDHVTEYLLEIYQHIKYPNPEQLRMMSQHTNLTIKQLTSWFGNTRFKNRDSKPQPKKRKSLQNVETVQITTNTDANAVSDLANNLNESDSNREKTNDTNLDCLQQPNTQYDADQDVNDDEEDEEDEEIYDDLSYLNFPGAKSLPRHTLDYLMNIYKTNKYPNAEDIHKMSLETKLSCKKIKSWFDTSRFKLKHSKRKSQKNLLN